jgi:hypothetical protein
MVAMLRLAMGLLGLGQVSQAIRIATNRGRLVIEANGPNTNVIVKESGSGALLARTTRHEMDLNAGVYEIELWNNDGRLRLSTQEVRITRGGRAVVKAGTNPPKSP